MALHNAITSNQGDQTFTSFSYRCRNQYAQVVCPVKTTIPHAIIANNNDNSGFHVTCKRGYYNNGRNQCQAEKPSCQSSFIKNTYREDKKDNDKVKVCKESGLTIKYDKVPMTVLADTTGCKGAGGTKQTEIKWSDFGFNNRALCGKDAEVKNLNTLWGKNRKKHNRQIDYTCENIYNKTTRSCTLKVEDPNAHFISWGTPENKGMYTTCNTGYTLVSEL